MTASGPDEKYVLSTRVKKLCDFICNRSVCNYEDKLVKAIENDLWDASIIYSWNIFMIFIYEKIWQIRVVEKNEKNPYHTDKIFLEMCKKGTKPDDYLDGNLFSLNKLHEHKIGEDNIIAKSKEVFKKVDQQYFKEAQQILQKRNTCAHANSCDVSIYDINYVLVNLIKIISEIEKNHLPYFNKFLEGAILNHNEFYFSVNDYVYLIDKIDKINDSKDINIFSKLIELLTNSCFSEVFIEKMKLKAISCFIMANSFQNAYDIGEKIILPLIKHFSQDNIVSILDKVFDSKSCYNQILQANNMDKIFMQMFDHSINFSDDIKTEWIKFKDRLIENKFNSNFCVLISNIDEMYVNP